MTRWRVPASSGERRSFPASSGSPLHRIQSPFWPPAPRRSAPGHSGSNPPRGSRSRAPGRPGRCVRQDPDDSARSRRRCGTLQSRLVRDDDAIFPCLGGFAFSEHGDGSHIWRDFPDARLVVPQVLIQNDGHDALLRVTVQVEPRSSPGDVEQQIDDLFQRARGWIQIPASCRRKPDQCPRRIVPQPDERGNHRSPPRLP